MTEYIPDSWVVIKVSDNLHKVLGGWSGGYTNGSAWRMNSGIARCEKVGEYFEFHGYSGSLYRCHEGAWGLRMATAGVWRAIASESPGVELLPEATNWIELFGYNKND